MFLMQSLVEVDGIVSAPPAGANHIRLDWMTTSLPKKEDEQRRALKSGDPILRPYNNPYPRIPRLPLSPLTSPHGGINLTIASLILS
jgi:hypothetical protein